jgi:hypothetical protein
MNVLPIEKRIAIISALVEGNSLRLTSRMVGVSINTVTKLLVAAGQACSEYQSKVMRNLSCHRLQIDEIWCLLLREAEERTGREARAVRLR